MPHSSSKSYHREPSQSNALNPNRLNASIQPDNQSKNHNHSHMTDHTTHKTIPHTELSELILDKAQPWQVHNCKVLKLHANSQGNLPFLYHYDKLSDSVKHQYPLTGKLLSNFNKKMTATEACQLIGIPSDNIPSPKFIKITGTIVIFHEPLQLAIRLLWSNTNKSEEAIYCQTDSQAIQKAMENWQFVGRIDTLYKNTSYQNHSSQQPPPMFVVFDELADNINQSHYPIPLSNGYQSMPHNFAVTVIDQLQNNQNQLSWVDEAIKMRIN